MALSWWSALSSIGSMRMRITSCTYGMAAASQIGKEIDAAGHGS
jgi:hypothetical protein